MKLSKIYALPLVMLVLVASCKRDRFETHDDAGSNDQSAVNIAAKDLVVPASFSFSSEKTLNVRVKVADAKAGERYAIKIYADEPSTGKIISTGLTNASSEYTSVLTVPAWLEYIYIAKVNPDGSSKYEKVKANQFASAMFTNGQQQKPFIIKKSSGISCTDCSSSMSNPTGNKFIIDDRVCITGNNIGGLSVTMLDAVVTISGTMTSTVNITLGSNTELRLCGSGTINTINIQANGSPANVYFLEGSTIKVNNIVTSTSGATIKNWSDSTVIANSFNPSHIEINNYGKMYFMGAINFDYSTITNDGQMYFMGSGYMVLNASVNTITNNNYMYVENNIGNYPQNIITNNCHLEVKGMIDNEGDIINKGYIKAGTYQQNKTDFAFLELNNGAMLSTGNVYLNAGTIKGTGTSRSIVKVDNYSDLEQYYTQPPALEGTLDYCDVNGVEVNIGLVLNSSAGFSCSGSIATSACNPEGFGSSSITDSDNDGVFDVFDEYPNDAARAFNSYYPAANSMATIAFEDLWPTLGDYDFNDMAVNFNIQQILNPSGQVIEYKVKVKVKAVGGSFENGLGFQLDEIAPGDISTVTGQSLVKNLITRNANNTEAAQSKAVIICFDSPEPLIHRAAGSMFNTIKTNGTGTSDSMFINITFANPIAPTKLTINKFNPFIFTKQRRGYEVHLPNYVPTSLANTSLFGTYADRSNVSTGTYYKTANGLPWAMLIPEDFSYPAEKAAITSAYNYFDDWAISAGNSYTNWFTNDAGNRNTGSIY
jgi:LruC domain-containing protein